MRRFSSILVAIIAIASLIAPATVSAAPIGPRTAGLADAFTGMTDGLEGAFWNPAGLAWLERPELAAFLSTAGSDADDPSYFIGYAIPPEDLGAGAVWWRRDVTSLPGDGLLTADSLAYTYAVKVNSSVSVGGTIRLQSEQATFPDLVLPEWSGYGLDLGLLWKATPRLGVGIAAKDVNGTPLTSDFGLTTETPLGVRGGVSYRFNSRMVLNLDVTDVLNNSVAGTGVAVGVEFSVSPRVQLRAGVATAGDSLAIAGGLGFRSARLRADLTVVDTDNSVESVAGLTYLF